MFAKKNNKKTNGVHCNKRWHKPFLSILFATFIFCSSFVFCIPVSAACSCNSKYLTYSNLNSTSHSVACSQCKTTTIEEHELTTGTSINGTKCKKSYCKLCGATVTTHQNPSYTYSATGCVLSCRTCGTKSTSTHQYKYSYSNFRYCLRSCVNCRTIEKVSHLWVTTEYPATYTSPACTVKNCTQCEHEETTYYGDPLPIPPGDHPTGGLPDIDLDVDNQNDFAWNIYKLMCSIAMPLAIISFASCGYQFLGSIFLGTYSMPGGGDMQKAQKQFVYTLLFIMLIILLPYIFRAAINFFEQSAWNP